MEWKTSVRYVLAASGVLCMGGVAYLTLFTGSIPTQDYDRAYTAPTLRVKGDVVDEKERGRATWASRAAMPYIPRPPAEGDNSGSV